MAWHLDEGYFLDLENTKEIISEGSISIDMNYTAQPFLEEINLVSETELSLSVLQFISLDLLQLVPDKFKNSAILQDYLDEAGIQIGGWLTSVYNITKLVNPNTVGTVQYLRYLGELIGVEFTPEDDTSTGKLRKELVDAIDWYKIKGTYESVQVLALIQQFTVNFYDMYTNDYETFYMTDWFVGDEDENPAGFDSTYYKSPHFGLEVLLNVVHEEGSIDYLWKAAYLNNLSFQVERTRPIHTVPHYLILLNPKTDELGNIIEVDGEIKTKVHGTWEVDGKYFDMAASADTWNFDDGTYFDQSTESFIKSITTWKLGTGGSYDVIDVQLEGTIEANDISITDSKITFEFMVPKTSECDGLNELGLYGTGSNNGLVLSSIFPKIDKTSDVELRVYVEVYKQDLS